MAPRADSSEWSSRRSHLAGRRASQMVAGSAGLGARGAPDRKGWEAEELVFAAGACSLYAIKRKKYNSN